MMVSLSWSMSWLIKAAVSTWVVSWNDVAEMKLSDCTAALVMPSTCVLHVGGVDDS
jgi:hypothetical protein